MDDLYYNNTKNIVIKYLRKHEISVMGHYACALEMSDGEFKSFTISRTEPNLEINIEKHIINIVNNVLILFKNKNILHLLLSFKNLELIDDNIFSIKICYSVIWLRSSIDDFSSPII